MSGPFTYEAERRLAGISAGVVIAGIVLLVALAAFGVL